MLSSVHLCLLGRGNSLGSGFGFTVVDNDFFRNKVIWLWSEKGCSGDTVNAFIYCGSMSVMA